MLFTFPDPSARAGRKVSALRATGIAVFAHALVFAAVALTLTKHEQVISFARPVEVRFLEPARPAPQPASAAQPRQVVPPMSQPMPPAKTVTPVRTRAAVKPTPMPTAVAPVEAAVAPAAVEDIPAAAASAATIAAPSVAPSAPLVEARFDADYLQNPKPAYPLASRRRGETGTVHLKVEVSKDGEALQVAVETSSGSPRLDQAAVEAVTRWKFVPARRGNSPVTTWVVVPVNFSLN